MMKKLLIVFFILLLIIPAFATNAPTWTGKYVNDYAGVLSNSAQLEAMLQELENNTTIEFAVVTLSSLPSDETKETYAYKIFNTWGIGKEKKDNGLLFLMIVNQTKGNRMRLEVGYGLEPYMTDASAGRILDGALPYYEQGDYSQAASIVVTESIALLKAEYVPGDVGSRVFSIAELVVAQLIAFLPLIILVIIIAIAFAGREKCPKCGSKKLKCEAEHCTCQKCGNKFKRKKKSGFVFIAGGGGFGGGGFGGGSSGGGGAGR
jgi:uncharacterized protein